MNNTKILIKNLTKVFKTEDGMSIEALYDINIDIKEKEFVSVIGPSGCGKTTLLSLVAGLLKPTSGSINVDGNEINGPGRDRGVIFQQDAVFLWRKVENNVAYGLQIAKIPKEERDRIVKHYLSLVGLEKFAKLYPKELSGGMRKRVALAMVLANNPKVLLMDEPFGALDYATKIKLQNELIRIWQKEKKTTLFITHDIEEAIFLGDRIIILVDGKLADEYKIPFKRPRDDSIRFTDEFKKITNDLWKYLK